MKVLNLKLTGGASLGDVEVRVDGQPIQFKKNEFSNVMSMYQTDHDIVRIEIYRMLDIGGPLWFITQLFFFLISLFGILDIHRKEKCIIINFAMDVTLEEVSHVTLKGNPPKIDAKAIDVETDVKIDEISNQYQLDNEARKKMKWLRIAKALVAIITIAIILVVLMVK